MANCRIPPRGWRCSREPGHPGPCAAIKKPFVTYRYLDDKYGAVFARPDMTFKDVLDLFPVVFIGLHFVDHPGQFALSADVVGLIQRVAYSL